MKLLQMWSYFSFQNSFLHRNSRTNLALEKWISLTHQRSTNHESSLLFSFKTGRHAFQNKHWVNLGLLALKRTEQTKCYSLSDSCLIKQIKQINMFSLYIQKIPFFVRGMLFSYMYFICISFHIFHMYKVQ